MCGHKIVIISKKEAIKNDVKTEVEYGHTIFRRHSSKMGIKIINLKKRGKEFFSKT